MHKNNPILIKVPSELSFLKPTPTSQILHLGNKHDGGYVVSRSVLNQTEELVSYGLGHDISFENEFNTQCRNPIKISVYDHTVRKPNWFVLFTLRIYKLARPKTTRSFYYKKWLKDYKTFFKTNQHIRKKVISKGNNNGEISAIETIPTNSLNKIFLKIDIEGDEYDVLDSLNMEIAEFTGLAIEFHCVSLNFSKFKDLIIKLRKSHNLVYVHANNFSNISELGIPEALEISFVRKDLDSDFVDLDKINTNDFDFANSVRRPPYILLFS